MEVLQKDKTLDLAIKCVHYSRVDQITQALFGIFHYPVYTFGLNRYEIFYLLTHGSSVNNFDLMTKLARFLQFFAVVFISMKLLAVAESQFPLTKYFERR